MKRETGMNRFFLFLLILLLAFSSAFAKVGPISYKVGSETGYSRTISSETIGNIPSNSVIDLEVFNQFLWVAAGEGFGRFEPDIINNNPAQGTWNNFTTDDGIGQGGVSGLATGTTSWGEDVIWIATATDTIAAGDSYAAGGGVGFTADNGNTWYWMPQPIDSADVDSIAPTTTNVQNVTYDIAILKDRVWITSWAGGVRYLDMNTDLPVENWYWVNRPPDNNSFNVLEHLNHRGFSAAAMDTILWIGTAGGVNMSRDNGDTWQRFTFSSSNDNSLTGNWVIALGVQQTSTGKNILWASTMPAEGDGQYRGVTISMDEGISWKRVLGSPDNPVRANNFAFDDTVAYVATDDGLFKTVDYGENWAVFPPMVDINSGEAAYDSSVYAAAVGHDRLYVGGPEGLGISVDGGNYWTIERTYPEPNSPGTPATYAYPNPFSPNRVPVVRLQYEMKQAGYVSVEVYDFAMELLIRPVKDKYRPAGNWTEVWNGFGPGGQEIANGVYFYKISGGGEERWGKVMVLD